MKIKQKSWLWFLTWPFAHANYTTIWDTIYYPKGNQPGTDIIEHEKIHSVQQHKWTIIGLPFWLLLYLIGLPILWNPLRWRAEWEAYRKGSNYSIEQTREILRSAAYGWLIFHKRGN
jgi:hypothetical protein